MYNRKWITILIEALLCSFGLMLFSFFIHHKIPVQLFSFAGLLLSAFIISRNLRSVTDLKMITGGSLSSKKTILYVIFGIAAGSVLAILYRWHLDLRLFPVSFHLFIIAAALIGCMEEIVFRGFIQGFVQRINGPLAVLFSTLSHTGYKCCLFLSPIITENMDVGFLALWTFGAGIFSGVIRHFTKSLVPSLIAHALFDILVYAEFTHAPWWVW
jgi:membrane protease YdiL (CAAX protease family)